MANLNGTRTEANLKNAVLGELKAHASYLLFAAKAQEEGHSAVAKYFESTAVNEQEHSKIWQRLLGRDESPDIKPDQIKVGSTKDNLQTAINGETYENTKMYPSFMAGAAEEGFENIANLFNQVANIEKSHADYFKLLLDRLNSPAAAETISRDKLKCDKCGFIVSAKNHPAICPVCGGAGFSQF